MQTPELCRSFLFVPCANERALAKAASLDADVLIYDLEDAVLPEAQGVARQAAKHVFSTPSQAHRMLRLSGLDSGQAQADWAAVAQTPPNALVLPKAESAGDIDRLLAITAPVVPDIWVMLETPLGILAASEIMAHGQVAGLIIGPNDLTKALNAQPSEDRVALIPSIGLALLAARSHGKWAVDGVFNRFKDADGFEADARLGRKLGFDGKSLIHPNQVEATNRIFGPSEAEIARATAMVAAFDSARKAGKSVAVLDGEMIEELHIRQARHVLARADLIEQRAIR